MLGGGLGEGLEGLLDLEDLMVEARIRLLLLVEEAADLEDGLADLWVVLVMAAGTGGGFPVAARGREDLGLVEAVLRLILHLRLEDLLREVLDGWAVDGPWGRVHIPLILCDAHDGGAAEIKDKAFVLENLLRSLQNTSRLSRGHGC
jgi:hypothetical protein